MKGCSPEASVTLLSTASFTSYAVVVLNGARCLNQLQATVDALVAADVLWGSPGFSRFFWRRGSPAPTDFRRCYSAATRCPPFALGAGATPRITCIEFALLALGGETRAMRSTGWHKGAGEPPASRGGGVKTSALGARAGTCKSIYKPGICRVPVRPHGVSNT